MPHKRVHDYSILYPGSEIGHLTLIEPTRIVTENKDVKGWSCVCVCGALCKKYVGQLVRRRGLSCGCEDGRKKWGAKHANWQGVGELGHQYFISVESRAKRNNIAFELTIERAWALFKEQDGKCALTGIPIFFVGQRESRKTGINQTASLDRIDSRLGYVEGNVQWVHKDVNMMKKEYPEEYFLEICRLVTATAEAKTQLAV